MDSYKTLKHSKNSLKIKWENEYSFIRKKKKLTELVNQIIAFSFAAS
jgi:hypothetical protein